MIELTQSQMKELQEWFAANRQMIETLADYNRERSHGIMHRPEWVEQMEDFQETYNARLWGE